MEYYILLKLVKSIIVTFLRIMFLSKAQKQKCRSSTYTTKKIEFIKSILNGNNNKVNFRLQD
jgi:hypothetical protein